MTTLFSLGEGMTGFLRLAVPDRMRIEFHPVS
jgi:hypothetical protein